MSFLPEKRGWGLETGGSRLDYFVVLRVVVPSNNGYVTASDLLTANR